MSKKRLNQTDRHHILFQGRCWRTPTLKELREHPYCIVDVPKNSLHREIHENMHCIPIPKSVNVKSVLWQLKNLEEYGAISEDDTIEKRILVLISLFDCVEPPTAAALKMQLDIVRKYTEKTPQ